VQAWGNVIRVQAAAEDDIVGALEFVRDHKLAFWDALMCATAIRAGVRYLLTEDLQDGRLLGGMTIVNPFAPSGRNQTEDSRHRASHRDCFVALLLAMTAIWGVIASEAKQSR
jgi:hypothetical protein